MLGGIESMRSRSAVFLLTGVLAAGGADSASVNLVARKAARYFQALPAAMPGVQADTPERVELGRTLYFDPRLSINDSQSCATCHLLGGKSAGMDQRPTSPGARGETGTRNTPTVLNAGWQFVQFWDGRAKDLADQAGQPILNPIEMGMPDERSVVDKLVGLETYEQPFRAAFPDSDEPITYGNLREAIAAFERTLRSESRFDDFLAGDRSALTEQEVRGLDRFIRVNCVKCHDGPLVGGAIYEKLGIYGTFQNREDQGRFEVTGDDADRMRFKVPQLRNVAVTGPYFHDGSVVTLEEAVRIMARIQLDKELPDAQVADIVAFLGALTGKELEAPNEGQAE
jgi:cytochrome c peroxidase